MLSTMRHDHQHRQRQEHQQQQFPLECTQNIFSYLELKDCLSFAATSSTSLREILPAIRLRRDRTTKTNYGVIVTTPKIATSFSPSVSKYDVQIGTVDELKMIQNNKCFGNVNISHNKNSENGIIFEFPTLQQRVAQLAIRMPYTHPLYPSVMRLNKTLSSINDRPLENDINEDKDDNAIIHSGKSEITHMISSLQQYILPLKLHAKVLYNTVLSHHCYESNTTSLHNYIGDVLCVAYLLYDFDCPTYAEHSINVQWLTTKLRLYSPTCYQSWVLFHASILRTKPFTQRQRVRLGLLSPSTTSPSSSSNHNTDCFQYIDSMYDQLHVDGIIQTSKSLFGWWHAAGILQIRTDQFVKSEMCIIYDDFGPLGPNNSFRGRDIVRVRDITADTMTECLLLYQSTSSANAALHSTIREAIEWICIVHEQAYISRPMSVRIPMIRFN